MTPDDALELLRHLVGDLPPLPAPTTRDQATALLEQVAELRRAGDGLAAALRQHEAAAAGAARAVLHRHGDTKLIADSLGRSRQHVTDLLREQRAVDAVEELERARLAG